MPKPAHEICNSLSMRASPTLYQGTPYLASSFPGMWKSPRWVKLCHQQQATLPASQRELTSFHCPVMPWAYPYPHPPPPPSRRHVAAGPGRCDLLTHLCMLSLIACTWQMCEAWTSAAGALRPSRSPSQPGRARSTEVAAWWGQHSRALTWLSALPFHCWQFISHLPATCTDFILGLRFRATPSTELLQSGRLHN